MKRSIYYINTFLSFSIARILHIQRKASDVHINSPSGFHSFREIEYRNNIYRKAETALRFVKIGLKNKLLYFKYEKIRRILKQTIITYSNTF